MKKLCSQTIHLKASDLVMKEGQYIEFSSRICELLEEIPEALWRSGSMVISTQIRKVKTFQPQNASGVKVATKWPSQVDIDSYLEAVLQPHQKTGIEFLFKCLSGFSNGADNQHFGAILADEMGLGKTLTVIGLIWALVNPVRKQLLVSKVLIVTPVSLLKTWRSEFLKFLGTERVNPLVLDPSSTKDQRISIVEDFFQNKRRPVLIVSYEALRATDLHNVLVNNHNIGLIVCDEGHRLKTPSSQTYQTLTSFSTRRKIILTGTPMQNNMSEFFALVDFVNPCILGTLQSFNRVYGQVITRSQDASASAVEIQLANDRANALSEVLASFVLRRTSEVLVSILPPRAEYVLFLRPTTCQLDFYASLLETFKGQFQSESHDPLSLIMLLRKVCTYPKLLSDNDGAVDFGEKDLKELTKLKLEDFPKFIVLKKIVIDCLSRKEKIVIVSNFTTTLDLVQILLNEMGVRFVRLDGQTNSDKRNENIQIFNDERSEVPVFILSCKSGGVGLTLTTANNLILMDSSFNPSDDLQANARIYRYGQKRSVRLFKLIMTGTIEEKIFQRHQFKNSLSKALIDVFHNDANYSRKEMKDLFELKVYNDVRSCDSWELIQNGKRGDIFSYEPVSEDDLSGDDLLSSVNELSSFILKRKL
ncbi:hypothetical protein GEMRC1_006767 [Eukaryota sp. GEM-RC1]